MGGNQREPRVYLVDGIVVRVPVIDGMNILVDILFIILRVSPRASAACKNRGRG